MCALRYGDEDGKPDPNTTTFVRIRTPKLNTKNKRTTLLNCNTYKERERDESRSANDNHNSRGKHYSENSRVTPHIQQTSKHGGGGGAFLPYFLGQDRIQKRIMFIF